MKMKFKIQNSKFNPELDSGQNQFDSKSFFVLGQVLDDGFGIGFGF